MNLAVKPSATLFEISRLAKSDIKAAEEAILHFVKENFPELAVISVQINDSQVSLNSVNGFLKTSKEEFFFKFHSEEEEEKTLENNEYYQGQLLQDAGLPVITPLFASTEPGKQFLIYKKIIAPTAFDEFAKLERQFLQTGKYDEAQKNALLAAEAELLECQSTVYLSSLRAVPAQELANASIHQLFSSRLIAHNSAIPRLDIFYTAAEVVLPQERLSFSDFSKLHWTINGVQYDETLSEIIAQAKTLLAPAESGEVAAVIGHGDDHNGNKFFLNGKFILFDPAFAGLHPALLSFVKATVHNVFLHPFWLYDRKVLADPLKLTYQITTDEIVVEHNWSLPEISPLRVEILNLQREKVWQPLLKELRAKNLLPEDWREYLQKAFFCCPFLVTNLLDPKKFTPKTSVLAFSKCVELGAKSSTPNFIDTFFEKL